jgi:PAS domain S-box-containing protein
LKPVAARLSELLKLPVKMTEVVGLRPAPGEVLLLENLRFHAEEEANDPEFSKALASLAEVYVNDAFERLTGWKRDEIIGRTPFDIRILVDSNQRVSIVDKLQSGDKVRNLQVEFRTRNSEIRTALESAELIQIEGEPCVLVVAAVVAEVVLALARAMLFSLLDCSAGGGSPELRS